jgi:hypothetical protein
MPMVRSPLSRPAARAGRNRYIPRLTALEAREVPTTCVVNSLGDTGVGVAADHGDLRFCLSQANTRPGEDLIVFSVTGAINLTKALPDITDDLIINGPGADKLTVGPASCFIPFLVDSGVKASIDGVTVLNADCGGVWNKGTLTLAYVSVRGNGHLGPAGGIANYGSLTLFNSTVSGNRAFVAAGIYTGGGSVLTVLNSTIAGNWGEGNGSQGGQGGGIWSGGTVAVFNSTIASNWCTGEVPIGGGIFVAAGSFTMRDTIVALNAAGGGAPDVSGTVDSLGHNLIGNTQGASGFGATDLLNVDPRLAGLAANGGPTKTMALLPGSPAIDSGDNTDAPEWDQRGPGYPRIVNGTIDRGAFEVQNTAGPAGDRSVLATAPVAAPVPFRSPSLAPAGPGRPEARTAWEPAFLSAGTVQPATPSAFASLPRAAVDGSGVDVLGWDWL